MTLRFPQKGVALSIVSVVMLNAAAWSAPAADGSSDGPQVDDEVRITGSHLPHEESESTGPLVVLRRTDIERTPRNSLARLLQSLPVQNGATQSSNNGYGDGTGRVNLRGLGAERTLVLLNGRRFVFGGLGADSSVDVDSIPLAMIERIEVAPDGASPIYGADAVAGVVNVITRRDFSGAELDAGYSESGHGDGTVRSAHLVAGRQSLAGNVTLGAEFVDQEGVRQSARSYSRRVESLVSPNGPAVPSGSIYTAEGVFDVPEGNRQNLEPIFPPFYTRVPGSSGDHTADFRPLDPTFDLFNYAPYAFLQTPTRRASGWLQARYQWLPRIEWFAEGLVHRRLSRQDTAPASYTNFIAGAAPVDPQTNRQIIPADNYYNPFGVPVTGVFRRLVEAGPVGYRQDARTYRIVTGLRGTAGDWRLEGSMAWARSETSDLQTNQILRDEVRSAVGPSGLDDAGNVVCGVPDSTGHVPEERIVPGCVPLDLFGGMGTDGRGTITPDQIAWISRDIHNRGRNTQWLGDFVAFGPLGYLPAGAVQWAFGTQLRRESGELRLDPLAKRGVTNLVQFGTASEVSFDTREAFAEARLPLWKDATGARPLLLSLGARYTHSNAFSAAKTFREGLSWALTENMTLRGAYSDVFRAPGTLDLHAAALSEITAIDDPCGNGPDDTQRANCASQGVPDGRYEQNPAVGIPIVTGGNPDLRAEPGRSWSAGVLVDLPLRTPMQLTLDYWRVSLRDAISLPTPQGIVSECADSGSPDACARIRRFPDGTLAAVDARFANASRLSHSGVDFALRSTFTIGASVFAARLESTYLRSARSRPFSQAAGADRAGTFDWDTSSSWPRLRSNAILEATRGRWSALYSARHTGSFRECGDKNFFLYAYLDDTDCRRVSARLTHDLSAAYRLSDGLRLALTVADVTDSTPPRINLSGNANTDPTLYDVLGRYFTFRATFSPR